MRGYEPPEDRGLELAQGIVFEAQKELGRKLSSGERRDLLKDNTSWSSDYVARIVGQMHPIEELTPEQQDELYCMFEGMSKCDAINTLLAWLEHSQLAELLEGIEQARRDYEA